MKLAPLSLALVGVCFSGNSYTMENKPTTPKEKLSKARNLVNESNNIIQAKDHFLMVALFTSVEAANAYAITEEGKAADCRNNAKVLAYDVMKDDEVSLETKQGAGELYEQLMGKK